MFVVAIGPSGRSGDPQKVPGPVDAHSISIAAGGRRLAYSKYPVRQNVWSIAIPQTGVASLAAAVPVTTGSQRVEEMALSVDGEWIAFSSNILGEADLYRQRLPDGRPQLVEEIAGHEFHPSWSPDGSEIAFYTGGLEAARRGTGIFVVPASGGTPQLLPGDFAGGNPEWSPDGRAIAFQSEPPVRIWISSRDTTGMPWSEPQLLTDFSCQGAVWAPDGASLVCWVAGEGFARVSREGGVLSRYDLSTAGLRDEANSRFSPDGTRIYFVATQEDGSRGVWWIPVRGGAPTKVVAFDRPGVRASLGGVSDGNLYLVIAISESDIWVMDLEW